MTPNRSQLVTLSAATAGILLIMAWWTQSRMGERLLPHSFCITGSPTLLWLQ